LNVGVWVERAGVVAQRSARGAAGRGAGAARPEPAGAGPSGKKDDGGSDAQYQVKEK